MCFLLYDTFFFTKKGRAQRLHDLRCFIEINRKKNVIKNATAENKNNRKIIKTHPKKDVLKTSKSQRHSDYYGLRNRRVGCGRVAVLRATRFLEPFQQKMVIPVSILAPCEIRKGTRNLTFSVRKSFGGVNF